MGSTCSILKKRRNKKDASEMIQSRRVQFFSTCRCQSFSLPDSIMFYMAKNPSSPQVYEKMIQTCKYFYVKNPVLLISNLHHSDDGEWQLSFRKRQIDFSKAASKLWIIDFLSVQHGLFSDKHTFNQTILSSFLMPKLYKCDAKYVTFHNQTISYVDLPFLISSTEEINFDNITVQNKDGSNVGVEKIVEIALKAKRIHFQSYATLTNIASNTMKELIKIPHFSRLDVFTLFGIPESFDLETFYSFMKQNKTTKIVLHFDDSISEVFKNRLEEIVDEILATETHGYKSPCIYFAGLEWEKRKKLERIFSSHF